MASNPPYAICKTNAAMGNTNATMGTKGHDLRG